MRNTQHDMSCLCPQPNKKTILIVDASADFRQQIRQLSDNYCWLEASDGVQGLKMIKIYRPDLLLCDLHLPILSGFELIEEVRRDSIMLPILVLSTPCELALVAKVLRLGIQDFIFKPITDWAALATKLEQLVANKAVSHSDDLTETLVQSLQHSLQAEYEQEYERQTQERQAHLKFVIKQPALVRQLLYALLPEPESCVKGWRCHYVLLQDVQHSPLLFDAVWIANEQYLFFLLESSFDELPILETSLLIRPLFYDYLRRHSRIDIDLMALFHFLQQAVIQPIDTAPLPIILGKLEAKTGLLSVLYQGISVFLVDEKGNKKAIERKIQKVNIKQQEIIVTQQKISLMIEHRQESRFTLEITRS